MPQCEYETLDIRRRCCRLRIAIGQIEQLSARPVDEHRLRQVPVEPLQPCIARQAGHILARCIGQHRTAQQRRRLGSERNEILVLLVCLHERFELAQCITACGAACTRAHPEPQQVADGKQRERQ